MVFHPDVWWILSSSALPGQWLWGGFCHEDQGDGRRIDLDVSLGIPGEHSEVTV